MRQQAIPRNAFFNLIHDTHQHRPISVATEFVDTDWDAQDSILSDLDDNSPRISLQSSGQTTLDSFDEALTPRSSRNAESPTQIQGPSGPHLFRTWSDTIGQHAGGVAADDGLVLSMSPMTPKPRSHHHHHHYSRQHYYQHSDPASAHSPPPLPSGPFRYTREELDPSKLVGWTREMVAQSMLDAGIDMTMAHRFIENDINGQILVTLKFDDLRELDMPSFGMRTRVWNQIQALLRHGRRQQHLPHHHNNNNNNRADMSWPPTPIEEEPSREVCREERRQAWHQDDKPAIVRCGGSSGRSWHKRQSSSGGGRGTRQDNDAAIMPSDSVSIIGIEQVIPKPHYCSKGESCGKWKKQRRLIADFRRLYPHVDMDSSGAVVILGKDAGDPATAPAIDLDAFAEADAFADALADANKADKNNHDTLANTTSASIDDINTLSDEGGGGDDDDNDMLLQRPFSGAAPSLVASSDILGTETMPPLQYLQEAVPGGGGAQQARAPQDNVRRFLSFQHAVVGDSRENEVPPTPPFELVPAATAAQQRRRRQQEEQQQKEEHHQQQWQRQQQKAPHSGLRRLPKLSIPLNAHVPVQHSSAISSQGVTTLQQQHQEQQQQQQQQKQLQQQLQQRQHQYPIRKSSYSHNFVPYKMDKVDPRSPDLETPHNHRHHLPCRRLGTPFSELDVPVTTVPLGPVARDASQSVPPDMAYRTASSSPEYKNGSSGSQHQSSHYQHQQQQHQHPPRSTSRASARRPLFSLLPSVNEHKAVRVAPPRTTSPHDLASLSSSSSSPSPHAASRVVRQHPSSPLQAPPRGLYPWTSSSSSSSSSSFLSGLTRSSTNTTTPAAGVTSGQMPPPPPPKTSSSTSSSSSSLLSSIAAGISFQGPMKKRKTRLLRHDWHDAYFTLRGTRLNMHKDASTVDRTLEYIDIDDYAIACSSLASTSKLSAALKAVRLSSSSSAATANGSRVDKRNDPVAAFSFQLIPQDNKNNAAARRLRRRDSSLSSTSGGSGGGGLGEPSGDAVNGTGKTHHFAVRSRDDRIDWMREMMLAKALKQKGEGFEISVNGNMI